MTFMSVLLEYKLKHLLQKDLKGNIFFPVSFNCKGLYFALGSNGAFPGYGCYVKVIFPACSLGCLSTVFSLMRCLAPARALLFVDFPVGVFPSNTQHHPACMHTLYASIHIPAYLLSCPFTLECLMETKDPNLIWVWVDFAITSLAIDHLLLIDYHFSRILLWLVLIKHALSLFSGSPISSFVLWVLDGPSAFALNPSTELLTHPWKHSYLNSLSLTSVL